MEKFTQQDWVTTLQLVKLGAKSLDVTGQNYILAGILINKLEGMVTPPEEVAPPTGTGHAPVVEETPTEAK